jgi:hypothetical protein
MIRPDQRDAWPHFPGIIIGHVRKSEHVDD